MILNFLLKLLFFRPDESILDISELLILNYWFDTILLFNIVLIMFFCSKLNYCHDLSPIRYWYLYLRIYDF